MLVASETTERAAPSGDGPLAHGYIELARSAIKHRVDAFADDPSSDLW